MEKQCKNSEALSMVLNMNKRFLFTLLHLLVLLHISFSLEEGFAFSPLDFETPETEELEVTGEEIRIQDCATTHVLKIRNNGNAKNISCRTTATPLPNEGFITLTPFPKDFAISLDNKPVPFKYFFDGTEIVDIKNPDLSYPHYGYPHDKEGTLRFSFEMPAHSEVELKLCHSSVFASNTNGSVSVTCNIFNNLAKAKSYTLNIYSSNVDVDANLWLYKISIAQKTGSTDDLSESGVKYRYAIVDATTGLLDCTDFYEEIERIAFYYRTFFRTDYSWNASYYISNDRHLFFNDKDLTSHLLSPEDLFYLTKGQLRILRNAFYACHGYDFKSEAMKKYFKRIDELYYEEAGKWTLFVNPHFSETDFTEAEKANIELIRKMESIKEPLILSNYLK